MRGLNQGYFPQRSRWRSGHSRRYRYAFPRNFSRRKKGQKIAGILVLLLVLLTGFFLREIIRTYLGEKVWNECFQQSSADDDN